MRRMIMEKLIEWKERKSRKPILLTGVRQSGKTYIIQKFGEENFSSVAYINFEKSPNVASVFEEDLQPKRIIADLENLVVREKIQPGKTLLFFDEIQMAPKAITSLKYFQEELPGLHVIGAGSLLGVSLRDDKGSYPIGKVERMQLFPMNFVEFLWALGQEGLLTSLGKRDKESELPAQLFQPLKKSLLTYFAVGGMPEALSTWVRSQDYAQVEKVQEDILAGYAGDFSKHAPSSEVVNLESIWRAIPAQLAQDNSKFIFSRVKKSARAKDLESSIQWLIDAGLIHVLEKVENAQIPLSAYADHTYFKVYLCDVGLLSRRAGLSFKTILEETEALSTYRGALTENYVLTELIAQNFQPYYWRSGNTAELDFILESGGEVVPIEAKANLNTQAKSYREFVKKYRPNIGFKFSLKNRGVNQVESTTTFSLPLFLVHQLREYIR